jgi:Zn-dependent protease
MAQPAQGTGFRLGQVLGIPIYLHPSWLIIFFLITFSLSTQFRSADPGWSSSQHLALGIITSILFFVSVVFHELSHSVVARYYKIKVDSITLFIFGGLSRIEREPSSAKQEFSIAIAGPLASLFLGGCFVLVFRYWHGNAMVTAATDWLWQINVVLGLFNLVPGFPLDGGHILRGITWGVTGNFARATKIASTAGKIFAYLMIFAGIAQAMTGNWVGGLWTAFIGWFLLSAAQESVVQVAIRNTLTGVRAADIMTHDIPTVTRDISLEEYVQEVLRTGVRCHIVLGVGNPVGMVSLSSVRTTPRDEWANTSIQAVMLPIDQMHSALPDEPALGILERMQTEDINQMPVVSEGHIIGMIARDNILRVLQTRLHAGHMA